MAVRYADTEVDVDALNASGGVCQLAQSAHGAALRSTRDVFAEQSCNIAQDVADRYGDGDHMAAHARLQELVDAGEVTESSSRRMMFLVSSCASDQAIDSTVALMVALTTANMHSIGNFQQAGRTCEGVLWAQSKASVGDHYRLTGLHGCDSISPTFDEAYHPDDHPDGRLLGDLMRDDVGYTGRIPVDFEYKGNRYPFASQTTRRGETGVGDSLVRTRPDGAGPDRTLFGEPEGLVFWSDGERSPAGDAGTVHGTEELLAIEYWAEPIRSRPLAERTLTAVQRTYGAPRFVNAFIGGSDARPTLEVQVGTTSGDSFGPLLVVDVPEDRTREQLKEWLADTRVEFVLADTRRSARYQGHVDVSPDPHIALEGALFTDGETTLAAKTQEGVEVLAHVSEDDATRARKNGRERSSYLARTRTTDTLRDWTFSNREDPVAVAYVPSRRSNRQDDGGAGYVLMAGTPVQQLFVRTASTCQDDDLLWYSIGDTTGSVRPQCREVEGQGIVYSASRIDGLDEGLRAAMVAGVSMDVGLYKEGDDRTREQFTFSLLGHSAASRKLEADLAVLGAEARRLYEQHGTTGDTDLMIFEKLDQPPPLAAAAPVRRSNPSSADVATRYGSTPASQVEQAWHPACSAMASHIRTVANSGSPAALRMRQIGSMVDRAPSICF